MSDITQILDRVQQGDPKAAEELVPLVYEELRKLAAAKMAQIIKNLPFAALAVTLLFQAPIARADNSAPIRLTFEKSFAGRGPVPYLFHFDGSFGGDFTGQLFVGVLVEGPIDKQGQIFHVVPDFVFTDADGNLLFTVHIEGNQNSHTAKAVLNGVLSDGSPGAGSAGCPRGGHFQGTIRIMPN